MPTYKARTVSATLHVTKLERTLAKAIRNLRNAEVSSEAKNFEKTLAAGDRLYERPIGPDGSEKGVARFIGEFEDLPFFMVEAGEHIVHISEKNGIAPTIEAPPPQSPVPQLAEEDGDMDEDSSPLTSLGNTPSRGTPETSFLEDSQRNAMPIKSRQDSVVEPMPEQDTPSAPAPAPQAIGGFKPRQHRREPHVESQALALTVEVGCYTSSVSGEDIKMEVFLNGILVDSEYINTKRYSLGSVVRQEHFHGNRVHIQIEKPWIYCAADQASQSKLTAEERWTVAATALAEEANARERDTKGMLSPTAEFLSALSTVTFPERLREMKQSSIIDVVVTTGSGKKFNGGSHPFVHGPLRLASSKSKSLEVIALEEDPFKTEAVQTQEATVEEKTMDHEQSVKSMGEEQPAEKMDIDNDSSDPTPALPSTSSPEVPLARRTRSFQATQAQELQPREASPSKQDSTQEVDTIAATPKKKQTAHQDKVDALAQELHLTPHKSKVLMSFKNRKGKECGQRTVMDRLRDILKMKPENQENAKLELLAQLAAEGISLAKMASADADGASSSMPQSTEAPSTSSMQTRRRRSTRNQSIPHADDVPMPDVSNDPVAALAQARMDTAMDLGAAPGGHLAKRIESLSPHRSPVKRLGASSWAAPAESNVAKDDSSQVNMQRNASASPTKLRRGRSKLMADASEASEPTLSANEELSMQVPGPVSTSKSESKSTSSAGGGSKKKKKASAQQVPDGPSQEEALAAFQIPEICQGASVSYAGGDLHRSVVKSRPGEFIEQALVVGMRFVVL